MERMEGVDAGYLYMETPSMHMHTLKVPILTPPEGFHLSDFADLLRERLDRLPPLRRRVLGVPLALNHPVWIEDRPVDTDQHVREHTLPAPAGMAEFEDLVGEVAGTPLDRSRPLWEMHVAELADGRVGVVAKMHHSLADGAAANALLANIVDTIEQPALPPTPPMDPTPSRVELVRSALWDAIVQLFTVPALLAKTARALAAALTHKRQSETSSPRPVLDVPRTSFNGALTPRRSFATCSLPMADLKRVRRQLAERSTDPLKVTLNDVVLGVVSGALVAWLAERGERPRASLVAGVPVGTDGPDAPVRLAGNRISNLFTTLATDVADPIERLATISRTTVEAKGLQQALGHDMLTDWVQFTPPAPFSVAMRLYSRSRAASHHPAPFNLVVSNVPGLSEQVQVAGATLSDFFSVGPILEGIGLNITVWSYVDHLNFSFLACPDLLPELRPLISHLRPALEELLAASR